MGVIIFNGVASTDYNIEVETYPEYETPSKDYEAVHVPGRNGDVYISLESYKNVNRTYEISVASPEPNHYTRLANGVSEWLNSAVDYARLEDSYEPEYYRMAVYEDEVSISNILNHGGKTRVTFKCKPQRFLKSGDRPIIVPLTKTSPEQKVLYLESMLSKIIASLSYTFTFENNRLTIYDTPLNYGVASNRPIEEKVSKMEEIIFAINSKIPYRLSFNSNILNLSSENRTFTTGSNLDIRIDNIIKAFNTINTSIPFKFTFNGNNMQIADEKRMYTDPSTGKEVSTIPEYQPYGGSSLYNPTKFRALPIITIMGTGSGEFTIGKCRISISDIGGHVTIDSELQDCYSGSANKNYDVSLPNGFPVLEPGDNSFSFTGGITSVEVIPKWWTI